MPDLTFHTTDLNKYHFLITGGAGFIGSNLVEYLLKNNAGKVRVLDNLSTGRKENIAEFLSHPAFEFVEGDICDLETCKTAAEGIDFISHQAALGSVPRSVKDPVSTNAVNITGFLNMLVAAKDQQIKRFVYAASSSTYGDSKELPKVEERIGRPLSPYAVTKYVNELYADVFSRLYGISTIGLRYFNIFGPKQDPYGAYAAVIPLFIDAVMNGRSPVINGDGENTRDFTYVENAVQANVKALLTTNSEALNTVYNIAAGEKISLNELFRLISEVLNSTLKPIYGPFREGDIRDSLANLAKAQSTLGYQPTVKVREGLIRTVEYFSSAKHRFNNTEA